MRKKTIPQDTTSRFEKLDRLIPLVGLGIAAYVAGRAAAEKRAAEQRLASLNGVRRHQGVDAPALLDGFPDEDEPTARGRLRAKLDRFDVTKDLTKKVLLFLMLVGVIAVITGGGTFASFNAETGNPNSTVASGTLTMSDQVNSGTVCNSIDGASLDNFKATCDAILGLTNLAPGAIDPNVSGVGGAGGYAKVTIKNTGSINASLFSLFAPYTNARLDTGGSISSGQTVSSLTVTALEGPVSPGDTITVAASGNSQTFCAGAYAAAGATSITISATALSCSQTRTAAFNFPVGSRVNDTSTNTLIGGVTTTLNGAITNAQTSITVTSSASFPGTYPFTVQIDNEDLEVSNVTGTTWTVTRGVNGTSAAAHANGTTITSLPNTDCFDQKTTVAGGGSGTKGTDLNFNSPTTSPLCATELFWIQEQTTYGANTYNYCWFGRGSTFGDQTTHNNGGGGQDANEDSSGQCRTPTVITLDSSTSLASGSFPSDASSNVNLTFPAGTTLNGNIRPGDSITISQNGTSTSCQSAGTYYIGDPGPIAVNTCVTTGSAVTYTNSASVYDASAFTALNGDNHSSELANFDTAHSITGRIYMLPLHQNGQRVSSATVELARAGTSSAADTAGDTRTFYIGVYFPAPVATVQNNLQGLFSTFGLTWHIDQ